MHKYTSNNHEILNVKFVDDSMQFFYGAPWQQCELFSMINATEMTQTIKSHAYSLA